MLIFVLAKHKTKLLITLLTITTFSFVCDTFAQQDLDEGEIHLGSYGYICTSNCSKRGYSYSWCEAKHPTSDLPGITYWDYCSKKQGHDYRGKRCWHEHACGNHGQKYKWCYTGESGSSWGYCGLNVKPKRN